MPDPPSSPLTAALLLIGNELLSGKVTDSNGPLAIETFRAIGVDLKEVRVISDTVEGIGAAVRQLAATHDVVVTSGGVGPTHDDLTMKGIAQGFGVGLEQHEGLETAIRAFYASNPDQLRVWLRMASLPAGCELIFDEATVWPVYRMKNVYILPGIPQIFRRQFRVLKKRLANERIRQRTLYLTLGEGEIAEILERVGERFAAVEIGSYPLLTDGSMRTRVTLEGRDECALESATSWLAEALPEGAILSIERDEARLREP